MYKYHVPVSYTTSPNCLLEGKPLLLLYLTILPEYGLLFHGYTTNFGQLTQSHVTNLNTLSLSMFVPSYGMKDIELNTANHVYLASH